jgi:penicillin-binding protein 2
MQGLRVFRLVVTSLASLALAQLSFAAHVNPHALSSSKSKSQKISESQRTRRRLHHLARSHSAPVTRASAHSPSGTLRRHHYYERFYMSSFADGLTEGDATGGEDPVVRRAAIDALGNMNGTVVAINRPAAAFWRWSTRSWRCRVEHNLVRPSSFLWPWRR